MNSRRSLLLLIFALLVPSVAEGKTVIFWEPNFPAIETPALEKTVLEQALAAQRPVFVGLRDLEKPEALGDGALLILPYGSAFPADAWTTISNHLRHGNLLNIGGRPLRVPVWKQDDSWIVGQPQNAYSRFVGVPHTYVAPNTAGHFEWDESVVLPAVEVDAKRVFVTASDEGDGRRRGIGFLVNAAGDRTAAPVVAKDLFTDTETGERSLELTPPRARWVFLNFEAEPEYWRSAAGKTLLGETAAFAERGPVRLWVDLDRLTLEPGDRASATIDVLRSADNAGKITVDLLRNTQKLATVEFSSAETLHRQITFAPALSEPGLYAVAATLLIDGSAVERYTTGLWVRDSKLLTSGVTLQAGQNYFRLAGKPYLPIGTNYFSTDQFGASFFVGGSLGGNAWSWERDFSEMERHGVTMIRTGIWLNRWRYLEQISGAAGERLLRAIEAFLHSAARHHMQVLFTFFAFEPQTVEQGQGSQEAGRLGPGRNPYTDPVAIRAQSAWVASIAGRFRDVPFLSFDLINEPSFSNPGRPWRGNTPNNDATELAAWHRWLTERYASPAALAKAWNLPTTEFLSLATVPLPEVGDLQLVRSGNSKLARAVDYNLFAQDSFRRWATEIIRALRSSGAAQVVTVGQDEGGVTNRVLNLFIADSEIDYTTNHSWWRDDALLWDSLAAKRTDKPNLIEETGPQPVWSLDTSWRWDEINALPLLERKLALGFAATNAGSLQWDWARGDTFGILRGDGSFKQWVDVLSGIARFAREAQPYAADARPPEIALVLPQSLQLSVFNDWALEAQQKSVRALYHYARASAYAVGEYQLRQIGDPKLIIVPAPWILRQEAWELLMAKVQSGATLLISGRLDLDEHFQHVDGRTSNWLEGYAPALLTTRDNLVQWSGRSAQLSYGGLKTTYGERGSMPEGMFVEKSLGQGRILYCSLPLESAEEEAAVARVYRYAIERAGVKEAYQTTCPDPGILISPTRLSNATLYVLTSESSSSETVTFRDTASGSQVSLTLPSGRAALLLIDSQGRTAARYTPN